MPYDQQGLATEATTDTNAHKNEATWPFFLVAALIVVGWAASVALFGVPGLYIPAVAAVPVIWALLIWVSMG